MEDGPYTFEVTGDLASLECEVRGGRAGDVMVASLHMLLGPLFPAVCWLVLRLFLTAEPTEWMAGALWTLLAFAAAVGALVGVVWSQMMPTYFRWRVGLAVGFALMVGILGMIFEVSALEWWGPMVVLWSDGLIAAIQLAVRWTTRTTLSIDQHGVTIDGDRLPLDGLSPAVEGSELVLGGRRIPMGAHAAWEREWLAERITRLVEAADDGDERVEEKAALGRLVSRRQQTE